MSKTSKKLYKPKILVLEGLYSDTKDIVKLAGGEADEVYPWDEREIEDLMKYGGYDGLLLTGGGDVSPAMYGEKPHRNVYGVDHSRDNAEILALMYAEEMGIPVLGICRGSQIMTVYKGGKLKQDIDGHRGGTHPVLATSDARTFKRAINSRGMDVISLHHQCVRRPGKGMRIAARAMDGTPEAVESKDGLWLGVQYHPEMAALVNGNAFAIFQWLVQTAARVKGRRAPKVRFRDVKELVRVYTSGRTCSTARTRVAKNRQAGTRPFRGTQGTTSTGTSGGREGWPEGTEYGEWTEALVDRAAKSKYTFDNPCPCDDKECVYGFKCGSSLPRPDQTVIDVGGEEEVIHVCPTCAMQFDFKQDRDDHVRMHSDRALVARYPELEPPPGHEAWEDDEPTDDELSAIDRGDDVSNIARHVLAAE